MSSTATDYSAQYDRRWQRILDGMALKQPDRMPVVLYATWFGAARK